MMRKITVAGLFVLFSLVCLAQRGKSGALTVSTSIVVNEYTTLSANAASGATSITVANSNLNANGRFGGNLAAGDLIMIIQMQGATITGGLNPFDRFWGVPNDSSWGKVTTYNNCGNYEFAEVLSVPNATTINIECSLANNYTAAAKVQVIRVPRYTTLTINSGGTIGCDVWDSSKGGVASIEVLGNTVINTGGAINVSSEGFRGGLLDNDSSGYGIVNSAVMMMSYGKAKGEGIAGYNWSYDPYGGRYCNGAPANAGGGASAHNAGGGGGSNGGVVANWINGYGVPDVSAPNYITAWNLEDSWLSAFTASGGGRGGYTFSSNNHDPTIDGANNGAWGGDNRRPQGGRGGHPLDYSTGRLFFGGGGGAGDQDNNFAGAGGKGGGLVYLMSYGTVSGTGQILANGQNGVNATGVPLATGYAGQDGAGGAGGGGTIVVNSIGAISGITVSANGGTGGNQVLVKGAFYFGALNEAEGPGGGGGGGYIALSNAGPTENVLGGANGTTNSGIMTKFPPNGATKGNVGTKSTITNFQIVANNDTICSGQTATIKATLVGTVPGGTTIEWYTTATGGAPIASGATYTTPVLFVTTTYYVGTCPGTYRQPVTVVISGASVTTISPPVSMCKDSTTTLTATGGSAYAWAPAGSLNNPNIASPIATPVVTTTYTVSITTPCGVVKDSVKITVLPLPVAAISGTNTICAGGNTTLTASGGTSYIWNTGATTSSITVNPAVTTGYTVGVSNGSCLKDTSITVTVNPLPTPTITGTSPVCAGSPSTITATGGTSYSWSTGATTSSITVNPLTTTTYSVTVTKTGCNKDTTFTVNVNPKPSVSITPPSPTICNGSNVALLASGASTYTWAPPATLTCNNCPNPTATPTTTTTYTVIGTSALGCNDTTTVTVNVSGAIVAAITGKDTICAGSNTTLTASGGSTYVWSTGATTSNITVGPATNTTYSVMVSSGTCKDSANVTVIVNPVPSPTISANKITICVGDSSILTAGGGVSYLWNNGATTSSILVKPLSTTTYTVTVGSNPCTHDTTITITVNSLPVVTITPPQTICSGNNVNLTATGGGTYSWSNGATSSSISVSPLTTTTFTVTVTNGGCPKDTTVAITVNPTPTVIVSGNNSICKGDSTQLTATGGGTYVWSNGATTSSIMVKPANDSTFKVVVSNGSCSDSSNVTVTVNTKPIPTISRDTSICAGNTVQLNSSGGASYPWSPTAGLSSSNIPNPKATPLVTTEYIDTVANGGCIAIDSVLITVNPAPPISTTPYPSVTIVSGISTPLLVTPANKYVWTPSTGLSCDTCQSPDASPTVTTTYYVTVSNASGCTATDSIEVIVEANCGQVFIPTGFSPNGDGQNDILLLKGDCIQAVDFNIYDRWGNVVFRTQNMAQGWDGTYMGKPMETGTYSYFITVLTNTGTTSSKKGSISLVR